MVCSILNAFLKKGRFTCVLLCLVCLHASNGIRLGLFTGNVHRGGAPILLRRYHHHAPVFIRISPTMLRYPQRLPTPPRLPLPAPLRPVVAPYPQRVQPWPVYIPREPIVPRARLPAPVTPKAAAAPLSLKAKLAVLEKLSQLLRSGSLTHAQLLRFRKLLL